MYNHSNINKSNIQDENSNKDKLNRKVTVSKETIIPPIPENSYVRLSIQGYNYFEVLKMAKQPKATVCKLNKFEYVKLSTGECKKYSEAKLNSPIKDPNNLRKTFKKLREYIRTNFFGNPNELFVTITYRENMQDPKRLMKDFEKFMKKLKYHYKELKFEYIVIAEPQERGAWHIHMLLKAVNTKEKLVLDYNLLRALWGWQKGSVHCEPIKENVTELGAYFVAYFTNLVVNEDKEKPNDTTNKKIIKGGRLSMYPKNFKFFRTSRGIKKPKEITTKYNTLKKMGLEKTFEQAFSIDETYEIEVDGKKEEVSRNINKIQKEVWRKPKGKARKPKNSNRTATNNKANNPINNNLKADKYNNIFKIDKHNITKIKVDDTKQLSLTDYFDCKKLGTLQSWA